MGQFLLKNNMYLVTGLAAVLVVWAGLNWSSMPTLQQLATAFLIAIVLHLWEEGRFPGGFTEMITKNLNFTAKNRHFGEIITAVVVLVLVVVPWLFPQVMFLQLAWMLIGILEAVAHLAAIRISGSKRPYSPGLVTALFGMLPVSILGIVYVTQNGLVSGFDWLWAALFMLGGLLIAQRLVVVSSGMKYSEFLGNVRTALFKK